MSEPGGNFHFGEFLRQRIKKRGKIQPVVEAAGLNYNSIGYFFRAKTPDGMNIESRNREGLAKAAGFDEWKSLDAAWRVTPIESEERRPGPVYARGIVTAEQLRRIGEANDIAMLRSTMAAVLAELIEGGHGSYTLHNDTPGTRSAVINPQSPQAGLNAVEGGRLGQAGRHETPAGSK